ncbi:hypothetical protein [Jatrophihabitans sp.]|uniref:hypothetical protein n=1 Tax=Jatrophihabitans sp. TaxID=1932789 RepID=UPI0030C75E4D|nr:hypothetical protein [Jatrophihabitans sp.]
MTDYEGPIDVSFAPEHEAVQARENIPLLAWYDSYPDFGAGWAVFYEHPDAGACVEFVGGDLTNVDESVSAARRRIGDDLK